MSFSRRKFLTLAGATTVGTVAASPLQMLYARVANGQSITAEGYGPLIPDPNGLLDLPRGFRYNAFSRTGDRMSDGNPVPGDHDGMAAFPGPNNTTILVRNHEVNLSEVSEAVQAFDNSQKYDTLAFGGTTTLVVGPDRRLVQDYASLAGTINNCAGGLTPWGSWISCEETIDVTANQKHGYAFEVPINTQPRELAAPLPIRAMGRFIHEAIAVDPQTGFIYETEDNFAGVMGIRGLSFFYRFIPDRKITAPGQLANMGGRLFALKIKGSNGSVNLTNNPNLGGEVGKIRVGEAMPVEWVRIQNPDPEPTDKPVPDQALEAGGAIFMRNEGIWYGNDLIYFDSTQGGPPALDSTRGNGQVWAYDPKAETLTLLAEAPPDGNILDEPDNLTVSPFRDLFLCEDGGGEQFIRGLTPDGKLYTFARNAVSDNEFAGACFSTNPLTMYVNIQDPGITFAIWGPWDRRA